MGKLKRLVPPHWATLDNKAVTPRNIVTVRRSVLRHRPIHLQKPGCVVLTSPNPNARKKVMSKKQQRLESLSAEDIQRFWDTPCTLDPISGCHLWGDKLDTNGLSARFTMRGQGRLAAHRVAYFIYYGSIPPGSQVKHTCRNKNCIRREHLVVRLPRPTQPLKPHPMTRISDALAEEIHAASGATKEIAERFGVRAGTVRCIKRAMGLWKTLCC
jgi:hypothetical protein